MKIGKIIAINFNQLRVKISTDIKGNSVNISGNIYYFGNLGSFLKVKNAISETIVCEVVSIFDSDEFRSTLSFDGDSNRELLLKPVGTIGDDSRFYLGVGIYPSLYSDIEVVTQEDMACILRINGSDPEKGNGWKNEKGVVHEYFLLGTSKNLINYPIELSIDSFFNIHTAVLGNSGSGKSNTIAHILQDIYKKKSYSAIGSRIVLFDVNGEYKEALYNIENENLTVELRKPNAFPGDQYKKFILPHFLLTIDEWSSFLLASEAAQRPFWNNVLQESYRFYRIGNEDENERIKFKNYLRYKICNLVRSVLSVIDTDTSRMTSAAGAMSSVRSIIERNEELRAYSEDILGDIGSLHEACALSFGQNHDKLVQALEKVASKIDVDLLEEALAERISSGEYFDYKFLRIAADLLLLEEDAKGNRQLRTFTSTMLTRLDYFLENPDCKFMRDCDGVRSVEQFINYFWDQDENGFGHSQLVIVDTSELGPDILETLTSVLTRILFDKKRKALGDERRRKPLHFILDEAHRYIKKDYNYLLRENIFEKIAREGRKFAVFLMISSQRPSELSDTVLSQCSNFIIHRMQNEKDMKYIQAALPYFSEDFSGKIKQSILGEVLVFGNCVPLPLHVSVIEASPSPDSKNCHVPREWFVEE